MTLARSGLRALNGQAIPARERAMAFGIFNTGSSVGAVIAPLLIAQIATSLGWRWVFFITGAVGFVWAWIWLRYYQPPAKNRFLSAGERKLIPVPSHEADAAAGRASAPVISWFRLFTFREVHALMAAKFMTDAAWYFFITRLASSGVLPAVSTAQPRFAVSSTEGSLSVARAKIGCGLR